MFFNFATRTGLVQAVQYNKKDSRGRCCPMLYIQLSGTEQV